MMNVSVRMDNETKQEFEKFCKEVGLSISGAFNLFAKKVVREHRIPFDISTEDSFYSQQHQAHLKDLANDMSKGINCSEHELIEA
ncbi:MAG: type II toxin-antitoxin system RelB/DinJ family antitoxin [Treponema sp.]|mgnify:CR=1 FL=1|jgi:DNA-damage-inducible protein J|nr:type II toxin-antitoxin system RelB/DinJ family antitoxin [Spirochaetia bacterium]MDY3756631.1 type II toxin-antitoxin system RelB/DinJ family antitoxin [Treponema sp.]MDY4675245.1 type II toxin-antitoxin system RelB/DinJ family antitoxin [Treponema sp.]